MSDPVKHHYVSCWQMKRWSNDSDTVRKKSRAKRVVGVDRTNNSPLPFFKALREFNWEENLNTIYEEDGRCNYSVETKLVGWYDNIIPRLTNVMVYALEQDIVPPLTMGQRTLFWDYYVRRALERSPQVIDYVAQNLDFEQLKAKDLENARLGGQNGAEQRIVDAYEHKHFLNNLYQESRFERMSSKLRAAFENTGITYCKAAPGKSFVLPDRPAPLGKPVEFIAITPNYVVRPNREDNFDQILQLDENKTMEVNLVLYSAGQTIVGSSFRLLEKLCCIVDHTAIDFTTLGKRCPPNEWS